jgi:hypothetical protein
VGDNSGSYLNTTIGNCMKEIGIQAMLKDDQPAVMDAVEKLSAIESTSKEMFILGNEALRQGHVQPAVAVIRKLGGKVRSAVKPETDIRDEDKRSLPGGSCKPLWRSSTMRPPNSRRFTRRRRCIFTKWPISKRPMPCRGWKRAVPADYSPNLS